MKRTFFLIAAMMLACTFSAKSQGTVSYALPKTTITFEVEAVQNQFYAGPYAKYAQKYLGVEARMDDESTYILSSVKMIPCVEADQSRRYTVALSDNNLPAYLQLTSQGLVCAFDGTFGSESVWRFPSEAQSDFQMRGVSANYTSESATLYQNVDSESAYSKVSVQQNMVVEKSLDTKARETADLIFRLRKTRVQIITGDTDATYSGEAMSAAIDEIARLEKEYMSLFVGYSVTNTCKARFDVVPESGTRNQVYVAFRISDTEGLLPADNAGGKPYFIDITGEGISVEEKAASGARKPSQQVRYRIPSICTVRLSDGDRILLNSRVPIYQLGVDEWYPVFSVK